MLGAVGGRDRSRCLGGGFERAGGAWEIEGGLRGFYEASRTIAPTTILTPADCPRTYCSMVSEYGGEQYRRTIAPRRGWAARREVAASEESGVRQGGEVRCKRWDAKPYMLGFKKEGRSVQGKGMSRQERPARTESQLRAISIAVFRTSQIIISPQRVASRRPHDARTCC